MRRIVSTITFALAGIALAACSSASDQSPPVPGAITAAGGDAQTDTVGAILPIPLAVKVTDQDGKALSGVTVDWSATEGYLLSSSSKTDASGQDTVSLILATKPGEATATATVSGLPAVAFRATIIAGHPGALYYSGDSQTAPGGSAVAAPLLVVLKDRFGNPLSGATVTWTVASGGGSLSAYSETTDANGQAQVVWTLGPAAGEQTVTASVAGLTHTFTAVAS